MDKDSINCLILLNRWFLTEKFEENLLREILFANLTIYKKAEIVEILKRANFCEKMSENIKLFIFGCEIEDLFEELGEAICGLDL